MTISGEVPYIYTRWMQLLEIKENQLPIADAEGQDLFVVDRLTLCLPNDASTSLRDVFVRGTLTIKSEDPNNEKRPTLKCRRIYVIGGRIKVQKINLIDGYRFQMTFEEFSQAIHMLYAEALLRKSPLTQPERTLRFASLTHTFDLTSNINAKSLNGHTNLMTAAYCRDDEVVKLFLAAKADIHATAPGNWTALKLATMRGCTSIVTLLLDAKADPANHLSAQLTLAARKGHAFTVTALLQRGAQVERGLDGPLMYAIEKNHQPVITQLVAADLIGAAEFLVQAKKLGLKETVRSLLAAGVK